MWLLESNRYKHLIVGLAVYLPALVGLNFILCRLDLSSVLALCLVIGLMTAVEYGQKTCGSEFDWVDVLAGCFFPAVITAFVLLFL